MTYGPAISNVEHDGESCEVRQKHLGAVWFEDWFIHFIPSIAPNMSYATEMVKWN